MRFLRERLDLIHRSLGRNLSLPVLHPRKLPLGQISLGLIAVAALLLLPLLAELRATSEGDVEGLRKSVDQVEARAVGLANANATEPQIKDLSKYRIGWSRVLQTIIASLPADVQLQDVSFSIDGPHAVIKGEAAEYPAVVEYADNLRTSSFFSRVAIQAMALTTPLTPTTTVAPLPTAQHYTGGLAPVPSRASVPQSPPSIPPEFPTAMPTSGMSVPWLLTPIPSPVFIPAPPTSTPLTPPLIVTPTITGPDWPSGTPTASPTASPTPTATRPSYPFVVGSKDQTCDMSLPANYSGDLLTGQVLDIDGRGLPGVSVRVTSTHTDSPWSAETTTGQDGAYRFYLTKAVFKIQLASYISEVADELWMRGPTEQGACFWRVVFKKSSGETPSAIATATPTITPTPSRTPTITPTPPTGTLITGMATASNNSGSASLAVDGDTNTLWTAGGGPYQYWQESFDTAYYVNGITLLVTQMPSGNTTHVVHFYDAAGVEIAGSALTLSGATFEGQDISRSFATPVPAVRTMRIETLESPSNVAWREVRVYAGAGPTATPTPTATPVLEPDDTWQQAKPIAVGDNQARTFYKADDVDWAKFHTATGVTQTHYIRVYGGSSTNPTLELDEGNGDTGFLAYNDDVCASDPLITGTLKADTTYFLQINNSAQSIGSYSLTVRTTPITCDTPLSAAPSSPDTALAVPRVPSQNANPSGPRASGLAALGPKFPELRPEQASGKRASFIIVLDVRSGGDP